MLSKATVKAEGLQRWIIASDFHFPLQDDDVISILMQVCRDWRPHGVVLNGDLPDLNEIKHHPPDLSETWGLLDERKAMLQFLHALHHVIPRNCRVLETNANHSGSGPESRWRRYLSLRIPELKGLIKAVPTLQAALEYANLFHPQEEWSRIELVDYATIAKGLIAIHGEFVRPKAAYSARAMLEKYRVNLIHGHTHRMGYTTYRVPGIGGQSEHQMRAYEGGCCIRLDPVYTRAPDWQQGFTLVLADPAGEFNVEQVLVHKGRAISTTLGGTYVA
jgi:hypothetical protein